MLPQILGTKERRQLTTTEQLGKRSSNRDVLDRVETQHHDRTVDRCDLTGQPVERRVHNLQDPCAQRRIIADHLVQVLSGALRIFNKLDDLQCHLRKGRDMRDLLECTIYRLFTLFLSHRHCDCSIKWCSKLS